MWNASCSRLASAGSVALAQEHRMVASAAPPDTPQARACYRLSNALGWITVALMTAAAVGMVLTVGKS